MTITMVPRLHWRSPKVGVKVEGLRALALEFDRFGPGGSVPTQGLKRTAIKIRSFREGTSLGFSFGVMVSILGISQRRQLSS